MNQPKRLTPQKPASPPVSPNEGLPDATPSEQPVEMPADIPHEEPVAAVPYWSDYGEAPVPPAPSPDALSNLLVQVRDALKAMPVPALATPRLSGPDDAVLRVHIELFDRTGSVFVNDTDLPLIGFASVDAVRHGVSTVQAALTTLVMSPLIGRITQYLDNHTRRDAHLEIPLKDVRPPAALSPVDLEQGSGGVVL